MKYGVSVVFTGHDHIYERIKPQKGIKYFVTGSGGQLRAGRLPERASPFRQRVVDDAQVFLAAEIFKDEMVFNAISRTGRWWIPASSPAGRALARATATSSATWAFVLRLRLRIASPQS